MGQFLFYIKKGSRWIAEPTPRMEILYINLQDRCDCPLCGEHIRRGSFRMSRCNETHTLRYRDTRCTFFRFFWL